MTRFDLQPTLEGALLQLRPLRDADWEPLYAAASDPAIWALHPAHDRHEKPVFRSYFEDALRSGGTLIAVDRASGEVVGSSRYSFERARPGEVEIGWTFLARSHWGGAANRDMKRLMLRHAFGFVDTVIFLIGEHNLRSRRALEKIGGVLTDREHRADVGGRDVRHLVYAITADRFTRSPLTLEQVP